MAEPGQEVENPIADDGERSAAQDGSAPAGDGEEQPEPNAADSDSEGGVLVPDCYLLKLGALLSTTEGKPTLLTYITAAFMIYWYLQGARDVETQARRWHLAVQKERRHQEKGGNYRVPQGVMTETPADSTA